MTEGSGVVADQFAELVLVAFAMVIGAWVIFQLTGSLVRLVREVVRLAGGAQSQQDEQGEQEEPL